MRILLNLNSVKLRRGGKWIEKTVKMACEYMQKVESVNHLKEQMIQERHDKTEKAVELFNTGMTMKDIAIML